jgi:hypothetical protein
MPTCPVKRDEKEYKMRIGANTVYTAQAFSCRWVIREAPVFENKTYIIKY